MGEVMEARMIMLSKAEDSVLVLGYGSSHSFDINDDLTLETSLNEENMMLTVNLSGIEFNFTVNALKLRMFNQVLAAYNRLKKSRFEPALNWKDEFKKLGYVPCY